MEGAYLNSIGIQHNEGCLTIKCAYLNSITQ